MGTLRQQAGSSIQIAPRYVLHVISTVKHLYTKQRSLRRLRRMPSPLHPRSKNAPLRRPAQSTSRFCRPVRCAMPHRANGSSMRQYNHTIRHFEISLAQKSSSRSIASPAVDLDLRFLRRRDMADRVETRPLRTLIQGHTVITEVEISPGRRVPFSPGTPSACVKLPERQT